MSNNNIEEAKERCKKIITTKFNNDYSIDSVDKEAIETILKEQENSISKDTIREERNKYKKLSDEFYVKFLESNKLDMEIHDAGISCDAKVQILKELLEEKE